jgi:hypothetical protein
LDQHLWFPQFRFWFFRSSLPAYQLSYLSDCLLAVISLWDKDQQENYNQGETRFAADPFESVKLEHARFPLFL